MIPKEIIELSSSPGIFDAAEKIGSKFSLHIDQIGELDAQIREILRGRAKSENLIKDLQKFLEIDAQLAANIAEEVNKEVFSAMKSRMQTASAEQTASALEQAGGFSMEKPAQETPENITQADRNKILEGLENPQTHHTAPPPANLPGIEEDVADPLIDRLMQSPAGQAEKKIVDSPKPASDSVKPQNQPPTAPKTDPYREMV